MVQVVSTNVSGINRPGVFVNQTYTGSLPQPLASHSVGYIFVSTAGEEIFKEGYSSLVPYVPTQITSTEDYIRKIGGLPQPGVASSISYQAVKAFFDNAGSNGILYATRVTTTPEVLIDIPDAVGTGFRIFTLRINNRYFGNFDLEINDVDGIPMKGIITTGIDTLDNSYDIFEYLTGTDSEFSIYYEAERSSSDALVGKFKIYSKTANVVPEVQIFKAFQLLDAQTIAPLSVVDILSDYPDAVVSYAPIKNLGIRLSAKDKTTSLSIKEISGADLSAYNIALPTLSQVDIGTAGLAAADRSNFLRAYVAARGILITADQVFAIVPDTQYVDDATTPLRWNTVSSAYGAYKTTGTITFTNNVPTGNAVSTTGYLPDSVQIAYVNIAGENRVLIANGATPTEITQSFADALSEVLVEKGLDQYYTVTAQSVPYAANTLVFPNNGYSEVDVASANLLAKHGRPTVRPNLDTLLTPTAISVSSTIAGGGILTTAAAAFLIQPVVGMILFRGSQRLRVTTVTDAQHLVVKTLTGGTPATDAVPAPAYFDRSESNGFRNFDYVANITLSSTNGATPPIYPGISRMGSIDSNVVVTPDLTEAINFEGYKLQNTVRSSDYSFALRQGLTSGYFTPGFIFAPEAFATLVTDNDTYTRALALEDRLKVASAISVVAQGLTNDANFESATQHIGLIDCGGDIGDVTQATDELTRIKAVVGSAFGHLAYFAPYIFNEDNIPVPPSAYVAGVACSRYVTEGFQQPPAGARYPLRGASNLSFSINSQQQEITYALGLNAIRSMPNKGIVIWGSRTLSSNPLFKFINTRAILNVLIDVLGRSFDDILFEQIDSSGTLYSKVISIATTILNIFFRQGALYGNRPEQAYSIICNDSNNSASLLEQGTVRCDIYVATSPTLERIFISVARTPAGQVAIINDTFSRNLERFQDIIFNQNRI